LRDIDGGGSLVPWKPVVEQRLGQQLAATVRGGLASLEFAEQRGLPVGPCCPSLAPVLLGRGQLRPSRTSQRQTHSRFDNLEGYQAA